MIYNLFIIIIIYSIISPILKKKILNYFNKTEYVITISIFFSINLFIYYLYKKCYKKEKTNIINKLINNKKIILYFTLITVLKYSFIDNKMKYLKLTNLSKFIPQIKSLVILTTFLVGVFYYKEAKKIKDYIGTIFIFMGFILYDTKRLQINAKACVKADYIKESLKLFLDIFNIFVRILGLRTR